MSKLVSKEINIKVFKRPTRKTDNVAWTTNRKKKKKNSV